MLTTERLTSWFLGLGFPSLLIKYPSNAHSQEDVQTLHFQNASLAKGPFSDGAQE